MKHSCALELFSEAHFDVGEVVVVLGLLYRYDKGRFYPEGSEGNFDKVGIDKGEGYNINVPWPHGGFGDADYLAVWEHILMPVALDFNPDIVFISAGCDPGKFSHSEAFKLVHNGRIIIIVAAM